MASLLDSPSTETETEAKKIRGLLQLGAPFRASLPRAAAWILMAASVRRPSSSWACFRSFMRFTFLRGQVPPGLGLDLADGRGVKFLDLDWSTLRFGSGRKGQESRRG